MDEIEKLQLFENLHVSPHVLCSLEDEIGYIRQLKFKYIRLMRDNEFLIREIKKLCPQIIYEKQSYRERVHIWESYSNAYAEFIEELEAQGDS